MQHNPIIPRGINHVGVTVPDLDAATRLKDGLGALWCHHGLNHDDPPREGAEVERQFGLPKGAKITRQRLMRIGNGPNIEMSAVEAPRSAEPVSLADRGWNHISVHCDDIDALPRPTVTAGGVALSGTHGNSRHEDTPGNASVCIRPPWGGLVELQSVPGGYDLPEGGNEAWPWMRRPVAEAP